MCWECGVFSRVAQIINNQSLRPAEFSSVQLRFAEVIINAFRGSHGRTKASFSFGR